MDVKLLRSLDDPLREKTIWFGESEMLARLTVGTISRLIKTRGQADIKTEQIHRVLSSLYDFPLEWSSAALAHFPPVVRSFYENIKVEPRAGVTAAKVQQTMSTHKSLTTYLLQGGSAEPEALSFFSNTREPILFVLYSLGYCGQSEYGRLFPYALGAKDAFDDTTFKNGDACN